MAHRIAVAAIVLGLAGGPVAWAQLKIDQEVYPDVWNKPLEEEEEELEVEAPPEPEPEPVKPVPRKKPQVLYKLGPMNRRKFFYDRKTGLRINKFGKSGDKQPLPNEITPGIQKAIDRKLIVPVEDE